MDKTEKIVRQFMSEKMPFTYKANNDGRLMTNLANFYDWLKTKEAINYTRCCKSDSELLPTKEEMNNRLDDLANELNTDDKQTEKIYFESGFRYCQQVIKEHLTK